MVVDVSGTKRRPGPGAARLLAALVVLATPWTLALVAGPAAAAETAAVPAAALGLADVLQWAGTTSTAALGAGAATAAAEAEIDRARAARLPTVDLAAQYGWRDHPVEAQAGSFSFPTSEKASGQYALDAREVVWDGGRRGLAIAAASARAEATRLGGQATVQQAQLGAVEAYLNALELAGAAQVLELRRTALRSHLDVVHDLFAHGLVARNDPLETEVRVREIEDQVAAIADRRAVAAEDLNRRLGREPREPLALPDSLPAAPPLPWTRDELAGGADAHNAGAQAAAARVRASETATALARRAGRPAVFVGATNGYVDNEYLVHQGFNTLTAGVHWNLFDGGVRAADVRQAAARTAAAGHEQAETARQIQVAVDAAWRSWEQAGRELATARANVGAAAENLRLVEDQYTEGLARSSDVLDAEALLAQSRFDAVRRHYAAYRAQAELLIAAGQDATTFYRGAGTAPAGE